MWNNWVPSILTSKNSFDDTPHKHGDLLFRGSNRLFHTRSFGVNGKDIAKRTTNTSNKTPKTTNRSRLRLNNNCSWTRSINWSRNSNWIRNANYFWAAVYSIFMLEILEYVSKLEKDFIRR
jgi:hypothetical protein